MNNVQNESAMTGQHLNGRIGGKLQSIGRRRRFRLLWLCVKALAPSSHHAGKPILQPQPTQAPVKRLDHAKKEIVAARYYDIPAEALQEASELMQER